MLASIVSHGTCFWKFSKWSKMPRNYILNFVRILFLGGGVPLQPDGHTSQWELQRKLLPCDYKAVSTFTNLVTFRLLSSGESGSHWFMTKIQDFVAKGQVGWCFSLWVGEDKAICLIRCLKTQRHSTVAEQQEEPGFKVALFALGGGRGSLAEAVWLASSANHKPPL